MLTDMKCVWLFSIKALTTEFHRDVKTAIQKKKK